MGTIRDIVKMAENKNNNKRIAKNTLLLYFRMIVTMFVSIFTSRVILDSLGTEDFGIYNVVGGFISMFTIFRAGLVTTTQRFIAYDLGKNNHHELCNTYVTCTIIYIVISLLVFVFAETVGLWFLYNKLVIPVERTTAAFWTFQFSLLTLIIGLLCNTQNALIIAHEKMSAFAYISIFETFTKLAISYAIYTSPFDKLIFYAILMCVLQISIRMIYTIYCHKKFPDIKFKIEFNKEKFKSIFSFTGWAMFGGIGVILKGQGLNMLLNIFFGPVVNASRGIAVQVESAVAGFVTNFQTALNPQIIKTYAAKEYDSMFKLVNRSSRFSFCMLYLFILPLFLEAEMILDIWLKHVPEYSAVFLRLLFGIALFDAIANPLVRVIEASGKIKLDQIFCIVFTICIISVSYFCLSKGKDAHIVYIISLIFSITQFMVRLYIAHRNVGIDIYDFIKDVFGSNLLMVILSSIIPIIICNCVNDSVTRLFVVSLVSIFCVLVSTWFCVLSKGEKNFIKNKLVSRIRHK